ncbi:unnamed protein product [Scytosiphon promiscuus]
MVVLSGQRLLRGSGGGLPFAASLLCCLCALLAQKPAVAFVPGGGSSLPVSRYDNNKEGSSCRLAVGGPPGRSNSCGGRARLAASRGRRGGSGGAGAPLGMMFDTLAENMSAVANLFTGQTTITESSVEGALKEVKRALLDADVNLKVTNRLIEAVKTKAVGMKLVDGVSPEQQFVKVMNDELVEIMGAEQAPLARRTDGKPTVVLLAGLQGTGKTTAAAKLAKYLKQEEEPKKVLLVAGDIYRPAAIDQLITLGKRIDVEVFSMGQGVDPVEITKAGIARAVEGGFDTVIVDTAGRQVVDDTLMTELKNIQVASEADEVLLVVDAMTGQEAATLASVFNDKIGITGAVLTKMDGDTRGGAALSVQGVSNKPIKFVGVGEKLDDLEPFYPDRMASRILGMGDVVTLVEKAQKEMSEEEASQLAKKMIDAEFDFNDFLKQAQMMKGMGSLGGVANMIPGMAGKLSPQQLNEAEQGVQRAEGLIKYMNAEERRTPQLLLGDPTSPARCRRIAKDAGVKLSEISAFLKEFQSMRSNMSRMGKQMADGDPKGGAGGEPSPFQGLTGSDGGPGAAPVLNRQQRRQSKKNKGGRAAAPTKGFG